jgi:VWFA-related protein
MLKTLRVGCVLGATVVALVSSPRAQTPTPQTRFQGGTDLVQVDVSVLDGKRLPVRGLTQADFTLLVDGQPREIQAFTEINLPDRVRPTTAPWTREVPSDVVSNQTTQEEGRLVIIMFDRTIPVGEPSMTAKRTATAIVNQLGPGDLAAIVTTGGAETHNLTADRSRLLRTINQSDVSTGTSPEAEGIMAGFMAMVGASFLMSDLNDGRCLCGVCVPQAITRVADAVQTTPRRRKLLFFIGSNLILQAGHTIAAGPDVGCEVPLKDARNAMFAALDRASVTVHSIDPSGLALIGPTTRPSSPLSAGAVRTRGAVDTNEHLQRQGALTVLPDRTGGRTVMNTNSPDLRVNEIFRESDSYYLIGFRPTDVEKDGQPHTIAVKAKRSGLKVHSRNTYVSAPVHASSAPPPAPHPDALAEPVRESLTGLLPTSDVSIDLNTATFAVAGANRAAVTLAVSVDALVESLSRAAVKQGVPLEIVASAFDRGGRPKGIARQTVELSWPQTESPQDRRFDILSRLDLLPGDYEIRIAVSGGQPRRTASVYTYITVPAFDSVPLSLSNVVLEATAGTLTAPEDFLEGVLPIVPTTRREFAAADRIVGFLRIYQGTSRRDALSPVQMRLSVLNAQGKAVASQSTTLEAAQFANGRSVDHYLALPLAGLVPGEYLLQIEAHMGERTAGRAVRFAVTGRPSDRTGARDTDLSVRNE